MSTDDLVLNRFNFDQLLISSIDTLKTSAIEKYVNADETLLSIYAELEDLSDKSNSFKHHTNHLEDAISQNKEWVSTFGLKSSNSY
jgi:acetolactate synthase small subunit